MAQEKKSSAKSTKTSAGTKPGKTGSTSKGADTKKASPAHSSTAKKAAVDDEDEMETGSRGRSSGAATKTTTRAKDDGDM